MARLRDQYRTGQKSASEIKELLEQSRGVVGGKA
jgi:hypothetical protein